MRLTINYRIQNARALAGLGRRLILFSIVSSLALAGCTNSVRLTLDKKPRADTNNPGITINGGAVSTRSTEVELDFSAIEAVELLKSYRSDCEDGVWESYAAKKVWNLALENAEASVYVRYKDAAGHLSPCIRLSIAYDTEPPLNPTLAILVDGATVAPSPDVELSFSAMAASEMSITDGAACTAGGSWQAYAPKLAWSLKAVDGKATVSVKYRDEAGNESSCVSASIELLGPASTIVWNTAPLSFVAGSTSTLTLSIQDAYGHVVSTDSTTHISFSLSGNARIEDVSVGAGDGSYGSGSEVVRVQGGTIQLRLTNNTAETFAISLSNDAGLTNPAALSLSVMHGAAASLAFFTQPAATGDADNALATQPVVAVLDSYGNVVADSTAIVSLDAYADSSCTAPIASSLVATQNPLTAVNGFATFTGVTLRKTSTIRIKANASGLLSACSQALSITHGAAVALSFVSQPSSGAWHEAMADFSVEALDAYGNSVSDMTGNVSLGLGVNPKLAAIVGGSPTVAFNAGVATFTGIRLDRDGSGYRIQASKAGLTSALSNAFTITGGPIMVGIKQGSEVMSSNNLIFVRDKYTPSVAIFDGQDLSTPTLLANISSYNYASLSSSMTASGNYLYIGHTTVGIAIWDISTPSDPIFAGSIDQAGSIAALAVIGSTLFVGTGAGLVAAYDMTNKAQPTLLGTYTAAASVQSLQYDSGKLYIALAASGVQILDVSNPASISILGTFATGGNAQKVLVDGSTLYVAAGAAGVQALDVSVPTAIALRSSLALGDAADLYRNSTVLWVADKNNAVRSVDISNPQSIAFIGSLVPFNYDLLGISGMGTTVFAATEDFGWGIIDASNPAAMAIRPMGDSNYPYMNRVVGNKVYLFDLYQLVGMDLSSPRFPKMLGAFNDDFAWGSFDGAIAGNYAYVGAQSSLYIADISVPGTMTGVSGNFPCDCLGTTYGDGKVFSLDYSAVTLKVIDVSSPAAPTLLGQSPVLAASGVDIWNAQVNYSSGQAVVAYKSGFKILDVSVPAAITVLSSYVPGTTVKDVVVDGSLAYLRTDGKLHVVDISDPSNPSLLSQFAIPGASGTDRIVKNGNRIVTTDSSTDITYVIDVSNPAAPSLMIALPKPVESDCAEATSVLARSVLLSCSNGGFFVYPNVLP